MTPDLETDLLGLLRARPHGWKEFELLLTLAGRGHRAFEPRGRARAGSHLDLYRRHFRLFHVLYTLRDRLRESGVADLSVHCLDIRLLEYRNPAGSSLEPRDEVREHYRSLETLLGITEADVAVLIDEGLDRVTLRDQRSRALATLGLEDPVTDRQIRLRFHELAFEHHPDRGGDAARFREISSAAACLR